MAENILEIVEDNLLQLAKKYQTFLKNENLKYEDIKDYDSELNDIMERYKTLKNIQSTVSSQDLSILYSEYNTIFQDFKSKYESGYFMPKAGVDGKDGLSAFDIAKKNGFTGTEIEWLQSLKGADGQGSSVSDVSFIQVKQGEQTLADIISDIYGKIGQHTGQLGSLNGNVNNISSNMLNSKINTLFELITGKYEFDENGNSILVNAGLLQRFEELYLQVNPPQGGAM